MIKFVSFYFIPLVSLWAENCIKMQVLLKEMCETSRKICNSKMKTRFAYLMRLLSHQPMLWSVIVPQMHSVCFSWGYFTANDLCVSELHFKNKKINECNLASEYKRIVCMGVIVFARQMKTKARKSVRWCGVLLILCSCMENCKAIQTARSAGQCHSVWVTMKWQHGKLSQHMGMENTLLLFCDIFQIPSAQCQACGFVRIILLLWLWSVFVV